MHPKLINTVLQEGMVIKGIQYIDLHTSKHLHEVV